MPSMSPRLLTGSSYDHLGRDAVNFPDASGSSKPDWHHFHLKLPCRELYRSPDTGGLRMTDPRRNDVEDWCLIHLRHGWAESRSESGYTHTFKIQSDRDAMLFKLTWADEMVREHWDMGAYP